jgi:hypothetical protein
VNYFARKHGLTAAEAREIIKGWRQQRKSKSAGAKEALNRNWALRDVSS